MGKRQTMADVDSYYVAVLILTMVLVVINIVAYGIATATILPSWSVWTLLVVDVIYIFVLIAAVTWSFWKWHTYKPTNKFFYKTEPEKIEA
jgi:hypothetical protein